MKPPDMLIDPTKDYYAALGVKKDATLKQIKLARKKLSFKYHPDHGGDSERFVAVQDAYEVLGNADNRKYYDRIRVEYRSDAPWSYDSSAQRQDPFEGFSAKKLQDFVVDSLFLFSKKLDIWLPPVIMNDFHTAVDFVYETWDAVMSQEPENIETVCMRFGAFQVNRPNTLPYRGDEDE